MAKYTYEGIPVEAEQYQTGLEDDLIMVQAYYRHDLAEAWYGKEIADDTTARIQVPIIVLDDNGSYSFIYPTDWIVTQEDGSRIVVSDEDFQQVYERTND